MAGSRSKKGARRRPSDASAEQLERKALSYLQRFDSSASNLRRVLRNHAGRCLPKDDEEALQAAEGRIDALVQRYLESGLLDDQRYARHLARSLRQRGSSRKAIAHKMRARGIDDSVTEEALTAVDEEAGGDGDLAAARKLVRRRRLGPHRPAEERAAKRHRDLGALARAGFSFDTAHCALELPEDEETL